MASLLLFLSTVFIAVSLTAADLKPAFEFQLDVSKPPESRWSGAVEMVVAANGWEYTFGPIFATEVWLPMPDSIAPELESIIRDAQPEMYGELKGLAASFDRVGHPEINTTVLSMWAYMYELAHVTEVDIGDATAVEPKKEVKQSKAGSSRLFARSAASACAGLLVLPSNRSLPVLHGRNLDLPPFSLRNLTLVVSVVNSSVSSSHVLYQLIGNLWWTANDFTSRRDNGITCEGNWKTEAMNVTLSSAMQRIRTLQMPLARLFRAIHEQQMTIADVVEWTVGMNTPAPFYLIMSGAQRQAAVLSKAFFLNSTHTRVRYLNDSSSGSNASWFLFQTNNDWWVPGPDPGDGCSSAIRNQVAENFLSSIGPSLGTTNMGVWMTLNQFPVHNAETAFTAVMSVDPSTPTLVLTHQAVFGYPLLPWCPPSNTDAQCNTCGP